MSGYLSRLKQSIFTASDAHGEQLVIVAVFKACHLFLQV